MAMTAEIKGKKLIVTIDMYNPPRASASGKSLKVASSEGNQKMTLQVNGHNVVIGLNAYYANEEYEAADE